jgi:hypothetical protein
VSTVTFFMSLFIRDHRECRNHQLATRRIIIKRRHATFFDPASFRSPEREWYSRISIGGAFQPVNG